LIAKLIYDKDTTPTTMSAENLHIRLQNVENSIAHLTRTVERLSGNHYASKASIPLSPMQPMDNNAPTYRNTIMRSRNNVFAPSRDNEFRRPPQDMQQELPPVNLSDLLQTGETVTFQINTGKDGEGNITFKTVLATFDGTTLAVKECEAIPSLVGVKSSKPGEILFKFMFALKEANLITRTFNALPWRLCSVVRDGQRQTLSQLRKAKFDTESQ
jgi:hypothetical protein